MRSRPARASQPIASRIRRRVGDGSLALLILPLVGRDRGPDSPGHDMTRAGASASIQAGIESPAPPGAIHFKEIATGSGIDFVHRSGMTAELNFPTVLGSGVAIFDADGDGRMDLYCLTATEFPIERSTAAPNRLYRNLDDGRFEDATASGLAGFSVGEAFADLDNDGDIDIVVNHKDAPPALLRNDTATDNRWLRLRHVGTRSNRDAIGARVEVEAGGRTIVRQRKGG